ncbi:MAG: hypothetical protein NTU41_07905 [Chloroflexi bacterium]|nr:hypothetical protein [Chloroflexota bacterium]
MNRFQQIVVLGLVAIVLDDFVWEVKSAIETDSNVWAPSLGAAVLALAAVAIAIILMKKPRGT